MDHVEGFAAPRFGHLVVPDVAKRKAEYSVDAPCRARGAGPAVWHLPIAFGRADAWLATAPPDLAVAVIHHHHRVAIVTRGRSLSAPHPRIPGVHGPLDLRVLGHHFGSRRSWML